MLNLLDKTLDVILKFIMGLSALMVMSVSTLQVISRFVTQLPIGWSTDVLRMSFIYAIFSGAAYCAKLNSHINLDVILSLFSDRIRKILEMLSPSVETMATRRPAASAASNSVSHLSTGFS